MTRRKGELTRRRIDREWPHQVALRANQLRGKKHEKVHDFCRNLLLCPRGHAFRRDDIDYVVFCFADPTHADLFCARFKGEGCDQKQQRGKRSLQYERRKVDIN
jgi:hypothetical protein